MRLCPFKERKWRLHRGKEHQKQTGKELAVRHNKLYTVCPRSENAKAKTDVGYSCSKE
jgi:hypothetical protein